MITLPLQAGLRTLHEAGPEVRRAISGVLDELTEVELETNTRRNLPFFGSVIQSLKQKGSVRGLRISQVPHSRLDPPQSESEQQSLSNMSTIGGNGRLKKVTQENGISEDRNNRYIIQIEKISGMKQKRIHIPSFLSH